jgi:hypothetical protein
MLSEISIYDSKQTGHTNKDTVSKEIRELFAIL